jgi:two-component system, chemotaxis family, sensor kinase Cph1
LREFLLRACHDLRTALRAVRTNAELLLQTPEERERKQSEEILRFLVSGARDVDALVEALSNYALALHIQPSSYAVSTGVLLRTVLAKLAAEIRDCAAVVTCDDLPRTIGDPDRLMQLFENLLRNAIKHRGDAAPRIQVSARQQNGEWIFAVRDNGPGIEAEDLARIFRPFERLGRNRGGAGLGLAICREIVLAHRGRIWAESVVGQGTAVYFTIPSE